MLMFFFLRKKPSKVITLVLFVLANLILAALIIYEVLITTTTAGPTTDHYEYAFQLALFPVVLVNIAAACTHTAFYFAFYIFGFANAQYQSLFFSFNAQILFWIICAMVSKFKHRRSKKKPAHNQLLQNLMDAHSEDVERNQCAADELQSAVQRDRTSSRSINSIQSSSSSIRTSSSSFVAASPILTGISPAIQPNLLERCASDMSTAAVQGNRPIMQLPASSGSSMDEQKSDMCFVAAVSFPALTCTATNEEERGEKEDSSQLK